MEKKKKKKTHSFKRMCAVLLLLEVQFVDGSVGCFAFYFRRDFGLVCIDIVCALQMLRVAANLSNQSWSVSLGFARCVIFSFLLFFFFFFPSLFVSAGSKALLYLIRKRNEKWERVRKWFCVETESLKIVERCWYAGKFKLLSLPRFFATLHCEPGVLSYVWYRFVVSSRCFCYENFGFNTFAGMKSKILHNFGPNAHYTLNRKPSRPMQLSEVFNLMFDIDLLLLFFNDS